MFNANRKVLRYKGCPGFHTVDVFIGISERVNNLKGGIQERHTLFLQRRAAAHTTS